MLVGAGADAMLGLLFAEISCVRDRIAAADHAQFDSQRIELMAVGFHRRPWTEIGLPNAKRAD